MTKNLRFYLLTLFCAVFGMAWGGSITFADLNLENGVQYSDPFDGGDFTVTFSGGANDGKYYNTGSGIRIYGGGKMTFDPKESGKVIKKIVITYDGTNKPESANVVNEGTYDPGTGTWTGTSAQVVFTRPTGNGHWRIQKVEVTVETGSAVVLKDPELKFQPSSVKLNLGDEFTPPVFSKATTATVTFTTDNASVATVNNSGVIALAGGAGEAIITASAPGNSEYGAGTATCKITVNDPNGPGTEGKPYTVAQALDVISTLADGAKTSDKVYVKGVISSITEVSTEHGNATYLIKDNGATNELTIFRGKYLENANFTAADQINVGDNVVVYGQLQKYVSNGVTTPEMAQGNYLISINSTTTQKEEAGLAWSASSYTATIGATNTFPTLTNPHSLAITYSSSDTNVATIAADGKITLKAAGTTTIKAISAETDTYKAGEATYALTVKEQSGEQGDYLFHETFDQVNGTGGNDGTFNGASSKLNNNGQNPTDETWDVLTSVYGGKQCMRYGTGSADGVATTRSIALTGNGTLTFRAAGWNGTAANTLNVSATGATLSGDTEITLVNEQWNEYTVNISGGSGDVVITFSGRRGFLDEIGVTGEGGETPPTKQQAGLAWSEATAEATIGATNNEFPTLTNPHSLPVTYTSSKEDVATIAADGTITLVGEGKTTIKAASAETANYYAGSATYELTVVSGLAEAGLAWSETAIVAYIGATDNVFPTLTNPNNLPVTYTSGTKSVATIDESTGEITLLAPGKTTITATFAGDDNFKEGSAQYTLTVKNKAVEGNDVFVLVEDASTLAADDEIVIVGSRTADDETSYYGMSITQNSNNRAAEEVNMLSDGTIKPNSNVQRFTLEGNASGWYFGCDAGYIYASSSSGNQLKTKTEADDNAKATIAIEEGIATVIFQGSNTRNDLRFNYNGGTPLFACYASTSTMPKVQIFRRQTPATSVDVTIGSTGYATLYYSNKNLKIPSGVTAYTCKTNDGKKTIDTRSYTSVIPAGSAVVLKANPGTYTFQFAATGGTPAADNMLCGTDKVAAPVAPGDGEYTFYKLADGENGLRFYKVESGFKNGAHKAYLAVPASVAADSYSFELPDGIEDITVSPALEGATVYTLSGVRMNTNKLPAGIYIVNGKKVVIK